MNRTSQFAAAVAIALGMISAPASAQNAPANKPAANKPAAKKPAAKPASKAKAPAEKPLPAADTAQLEAAERTYFGSYECELNQSIDVGMNKATPGYVDVSFKKKTYTMKPVLSSTGALRLEDVKGSMLLIQIANKSMMLDTKVGQRVVDGCVHEKQRAAAKGAGSQA